MTSDVVTNILNNSTIDEFDRSRELRRYMNNNKLTVRSLAKTHPISYNKLCRIMIFEKMTEEEFKSMKDCEWTNEEIENTIRNKRAYTEKYFQIQLQSCLKHIKIVKSYSLDKETIEMVKELQNSLNYVMFLSDRCQR